MVPDARFGRWPWILLLSGALASACSREPPGPPSTNPAQPSEPARTSAIPNAAPSSDEPSSDPGTAATRRLDLVTFNVGLAPTVPRRAERAPKVVEQVSRSNADVLCLQEVWGEADVQRLTEALEARGRVVIRGPRQTAERETRCAANEASLVRSCVEKSCKRSRDPVACVLSSCGALVARLSPSCVSCLAQDPDLAPERALDTCTQGKASTDFVYSGNTGLLLASSRKAAAHDSFLLPSKNVARGVIRARLADPPIDVYCTHFTARGEIASRAEWQRLSADQAQVLVREIAERSGERPVAVLGDLNFATDAPAFAPFAQSRFQSSYAERDGRCTLCGGGPRFVIDHVLTRDPLQANGVDRLWDDEAISDHHGVKVTVTLPIRS